MPRPRSSPTMTRLAAARATGRVALALPLMLAVATPAFARAAPESFADLAEKLLPAVVNVSTTQTVKTAQSGERGQRRGPEIPQFPPGSPFEQFFKDFFDRQQRGERPDAPPRRATSLGSGFIIDPAGYVVTNNHVV